MKFLKILLWFLIVVFAFFGMLGLAGSSKGFGFCMIILAVLSLIGARKQPSEKKRAPEAEDPAPITEPAAEESAAEEPAAQEPSRQAPKFKYVEYRLAGVTYKDGRYSRQAALRAIKFRNPPFDEEPELHVEIQEYEGKPAVAVKANDRMLGYIPKARVKEFMADYPNYCGIDDIEITGRKHDDGTWLNGAIITVKIKNDELVDTFPSE